MLKRAKIKNWSVHLLDTLLLYVPENTVQSCRTWLVNIYHSLNKLFKFYGIFTYHIINPLYTNKFFLLV